MVSPRETTHWVCSSSSINIHPNKLSFQKVLHLESSITSNYVLLQCNLSKLTILLVLVINPGNMSRSLFMGIVTIVNPRSERKVWEFFSRVFWYYYFENMFIPKHYRMHGIFHDYVHYFIAPKNVFLSHMVHNPTRELPPCLHVSLSYGSCV